MLTDYTDLEEAIMNAPEPIILPRGSEEKVRIINHAEGEGEYGTWHNLTFDIPSEPLAKEIRKFINDPLQAQNAEEKIKQGVNRNFGYFVKCFDIDISRFDWDGLVGLEGWAILGVKKDDEYGDSNTISKFVVGPGEGTSADHGVDEPPF